MIVFDSNNVLLVFIVDYSYWSSYMFRGSARCQGYRPPYIYFARNFVLKITIWD